MYIMHREAESTVLFTTLPKMPCYNINFVITDSTFNDYFQGTW